MDYLIKYFLQRGVEIAQHPDAYLVPVSEIEQISLSPETEKKFKNVDYGNLLNKVNDIVFEDFPKVKNVQISHIDLFDEVIVESISFSFYEEYSMSRLGYYLKKGSYKACETDPLMSKVIKLEEKRPKKIKTVPVL